MKISVKITGIKYINEFNLYWSNDDYLALLKLFEFGDADQVNADELKEMLSMSMTDVEPDEAARIVLQYKLSDQLNEGQIQALSHEMMEDKVAEEYPEPELHFDLFNINQLLHGAFPKDFPNTEASVLSLELTIPVTDYNMTEEVMTKLIGESLVESSILKRLYDDQLDGTAPFSDASKFIWLMAKKGNYNYDVMTSRYWIEKEDISQTEYEATVVFHKDISKSEHH